MNKLLWAFVVFAVIGLTCFVSFGLIESHVDENGILHEPFFLVIFGWLSMFLSGIFLLAGFGARQ